MSFWRAEIRNFLWIDGISRISTALVIWEVLSIGMKVFATDIMIFFINRRTFLRLIPSSSLRFFPLIFVTPIVLRNLLEILNIFIRKEGVNYPNVPPSRLTSSYEPPPPLSGCSRSHRCEVIYFPCCPLRVTVLCSYEPAPSHHSRYRKSWTLMSEAYLLLGWLRLCTPSQIRWSFLEQCFCCCCSPLHFFVFIVAILGYTKRSWRFNTFRTDAPSIKLAIII